MSNLRLRSYKSLARYDLVGEVRRAIGSTLESGETTLETVAAQLKHYTASFKNSA